MHRLLIFLSRLIPLALTAVICQLRAGYNVVPQPLEILEGSGEYTIDRKTKVSYSKGAEATARYLVGALAPAMGYELPAKRASVASSGIALALDQALAETLGPEGYQLVVDEDGVKIGASTNQGLFYGVQTLRQLLPVAIFSRSERSVDWRVPHVSVVDKPRFAWRGLLLDVGRFFMGKEDVMKLIDTMAIHKLNTFHWHLTEDQGWRIEIKKFPRLTEIGGWRDGTVVGHARHYIQKRLPVVYDDLPHGGFYTQEEIKEVVAFAAERHITVVPEIELPGHAQAAVVAYPEFASSDEEIEVKKMWGVSHHIFSPEEKTIAFLKEILDEVLELFPSKYVHIGGDEAEKTLWEKSPRYQSLLKERGLKNMGEMQSWFVRQFDEYLTDKGRRLIGWDEILEGGLAEGATVMSWRDVDGAIAAARSGHDAVIATKESLYFNQYQSKDPTEPLAIGGLTTVEEVYQFEPVPDSLSATEAKHILGAQAQLWTEYIPNFKLVEYMAFPRTCALAEVLWLPREQKDFGRFQESLNTHLKRLSLQDVNFRRPHLDTADKTNRYQE